MHHWLVKTEPDSYSIDDLARDKVTSWDHVRNYQARNYLRQMALGDQVMIYHSSVVPPGVVGLASVSRAAYPEAAQFDRSSRYFDPVATKENPRWFSPDLKFQQRFGGVLELQALKGHKELQEMVLLKRGSRLSVQPISVEEFKIICRLASKL